MKRASVVVLLTGLAILPAFFGRAQTGDPNALADYLDPKISATGPVEKLKEKLDKGELKLSYESGQGYLRSVLRALGISSATQTLVFSKTSLQSHAITPRTPRALYFSDECYVGWVNGGENLRACQRRPGLWHAVLHTGKRTCGTPEAGSTNLRLPAMPQWPTD
ncbi:MAG: hypothetical protein QM758_29845 [Armatimonas sp.]